MPNEPDNPAIVAAREAEAAVAQCLAQDSSFLLEAGAGAGKTYSLIEALRKLLASQRARLRKKNQRIACITYTNAATDVITRRIDADPLVAVSTIHAFCWSIIRPFQPLLRKELAALDKWPTLLEESGGLQNRAIEYDLGYRKVLDEAVSLDHDDVLVLASKLLTFPKFQSIVANRYPYIFIDEYQDTSVGMMTAIAANLVGRHGGPVVGLFGDHWQRIYDKTCGHVTAEGLHEIGKRANFRSSVSVVEVLNKMRPSLPQAVHDPEMIGSADVFHTNAWSGGARRTGAGGGHWKGDLPADEAHRFLNLCTEHLTARGWDFSAEKTKVLLLTHNGLAAEQGYSELAKVFPYTDAYIKAADEHVAFLTSKIEPAVEAYKAHRYGRMFDVLGDEAPKFRSHKDKAQWSATMGRLNELREGGTVGDVLDHIFLTGHPRLPDKVYRREKENRDLVISEGGEMPGHIARLRSFRELQYTQIIALNAFLEGHTPFATKHSVKGDEFENVVVVLGRGWNKYNFDSFLEQAMSTNAIAADKVETYERNRNLFYVCCSRAQLRLALLFTQELSAGSLRTLNSWFGDEHVTDVGHGEFPML